MYRWIAIIVLICLFIVVGQELKFNIVANEELKKELEIRQKTILNYETKIVQYNKSAEQSAKTIKELRNNADDCYNKSLPDAIVDILQKHRGN